MDDPDTVSSTTCERLVGEARISGRREGLREALEACDVEELIAVWIRRPKADSPEGRAWEAGARQAHNWKAAAILALIKANEG